MNLVENKDYEIIPDKSDEQAWNVRVLSGLYTETVLNMVWLSLMVKVKKNICLLTLILSTHQIQNLLKKVLNFKNLPD